MGFCAVLYMVEMELPDRSREDEWHKWYANHIAKLLSVDGFHASQRFISRTNTPSPFLAIHDVDGPEVFASVSYKSVGGPSGTGEWQALMTNWYRNLFDGLDRMPELAMDQHLVVFDEGSAAPNGFADRITWLSIAGLDRSAQHRGVLILEAGEDTNAFSEISGARIFAPITGKFQ